MSAELKNRMGYMYVLIVLLDRDHSRGGYFVVVALSRQKAPLCKASQKTGEVFSRIFFYSLVDYRKNGLFSQRSSSRIILS